MEVAEALRKKGMSEAEIAEVTGLPEKGNDEVTVCFCGFLFAGVKLLFRVIDLII